MACKVLLGMWGKQPKIPRPLACPGLRSDRGMQPCVPKSTSEIYGFRIFSEFRTCRYHRPTDICMPRSDLRPVTCKGSWNFGAAYFLDSSNICMSRSEVRPWHANISWKFSAYPRFPKVLCMPRSDLRPGHAKGLGNFAGLVASVLVNICQKNIPWRIDNSYHQLVF